MMQFIAARSAAYGRKAGIFTPTYKQLQEPYDELLGTLNPIKRRASKTEGTIRTITGGIVDFWTLIDNELAGRGREYDDVCIDEAAFTKNGQMKETWNKSIKPTLLTRKGNVWVFSTPNGNDPENFFYDVCNNPELGFKQFYAPTSSNPFVDPEELEKERLANHPLVFQQEFLAEFVDWSGVQFFDLANMLEDGHAVDYPTRCEGVFAVIDSATKTGKEHDGTGVIYFGFQKFPKPRLYILDYDLVQIEGALLETWLPTVYQNLEHLVLATGARGGSLGAFIEDKASGMVLLQQARRRGWKAHPLDTAFTALGKDERAISVSGYVYQGLVKFTVKAFDKLVNFKGRQLNHMVSQVSSFRVGDKNANRADDLLDCMVYGTAIAFGDKVGF